MPLDDRPPPVGGSAAARTRERGRRRTRVASADAEQNAEQDSGGPYASVVFQHRWGSYALGGDRIEFGPGNGSGPRQPATVEPGERYQWMNGSLTSDGLRALITGRSPFQYALKLR